MAPSDATEKNRNIGAQLQSILYTTLLEKDFGKFTSCMTFDAHKLVHSELVLDYRYEIWHSPSALCSDMRNFFLYRCTSSVSALNYTAVEFFWNPSAIYTKWCAQTFPPIFWIFAIFDRNFANIVAPASDGNTNYVVFLKEQSLLKKTLKTSSKSAYKRQRNACTNYAPLERTAHRPRSATELQTNKN